MGYLKLKKWKWAQVLTDRCHQDDPWTFVLILLWGEGVGGGLLV